MCQTLEGQKERVTPAVAGDVLTSFKILASELDVPSLALAFDQSRFKKVKLNADWSTLIMSSVHSLAWLLNMNQSA